ncbi:calcium-dependent lipid-binding family protein [Striga asiatica]|uniref:Calcium-dependent lipid-binding family protein n=1 Tax=Striga asiatica TaxID=4170 RepID=A0A5A7QA72_STRAF|nr:calcium-dependent lipid-binding family protein [Striga asiatica]
MRSLSDATKSSRKTRRISVFHRLSLSNTTKSARKRKRISVFQRLSYCTNPPANGDSKPFESATTRRRDSTSNLMFLVRHGRNNHLEYSVTTIENNKNGNSLRLLADDDEDLPHNLFGSINENNVATLTHGSAAESPPPSDMHLTPATPTQRRPSPPKATAKSRRPQPPPAIRQAPHAGSHRVTAASLQPPI